MATLQDRVLGALRLEARTFEEVEADQNATNQALAVVLIAGLASAIGSAGATPGLIPFMLIGEVVAWLVWACVTFLVGTKLLPEPSTQADIGQMLRVLGFAAAPG